MDSTMTDLIKTLSTEISQTVAVEKIWLFGSFAYGKPTLDSDLDICIVVSDSNLRKRDLLISIRRSLAKTIAFPIDILIYYPDEFLNRSNIVSSLEYKIAHEGVSIYEH